MIDMKNGGQALAEQALTALDESPYLSMRLSRRNFRCEARAGRVTLRGVVNTYFQKQMAQETLRRVDGVEQIENLLEVTWA